MCQYIEKVEEMIKDVFVLLVMFVCVSFFIYINAVFPSLPKFLISGVLLFGGMLVLGAIIADNNNDRGW